MNSANSIFSHQIEIVESLSPHFASITVLTNDYSGQKLPANTEIRLTGWIEGSHIHSIVNFYTAFISLLKQEKFDLAFSHMVDTQAFLALPFLKTKRIPHIFWYAHAKKSTRANIVSVFSDINISSTVGSYPLLGKPFELIGQSINLEKFIFNPIRNPNRLKFVHIGRLDSSKKIFLLIQFIDLLTKNGFVCSLDFWGRMPNNLQTELLKKEFSARNNFIKYRGTCLRSDIPKILNEYGTFIHAFDGSLDKSILEATSVGLPVITLNQEYLNDFGKWGNEINDKSMSFLYSEFLEYIKLSNEELETEIINRRQIVLEKHSLKHWIQKFLNICENLLGNE